MLGALKNARVTAILTPLGEVKSITGFKEIGDKLLAGFAPDNTYEKGIAMAKWNAVAGDGMVKKSIDDIFRIFPDSAVHIGNKWKIYSHQPGEIPMNVTSYYTLEDIDDNLASINLHGKIDTDSSINSLNQSSATLSGTQEGDYKIDISSGMMMNGTVSAHLEGSVQTTGKEIPVSISIKVKIEGKKL